MSSKRFAGEVIWGSCALGFNETCFWVLCLAIPYVPMDEANAQARPDGIPYSAWRLLPCVTVDALISYFYDIIGGTALPPMQVGVL